MSSLFEFYQPRKIDFQELVSINDWSIKVYSISQNEIFGSQEILKNVIGQIPNWINTAIDSDIPTYQVGFLIVHEAREGVWILFSWWTGGEMIETKVYFSDFDSPKVITTSPYKTSSLICVWELEIFAHERQAWIAHILMNPNSPDFEGYLRNTLKAE